MESTPTNSCTDDVDKEGLIEQEMFNPGGDIQTACLWSCFAQLLQDDLGNIKKHWNIHLIRGSRHDTRELKQTRRRRKRERHLKM